MTYYKLSNMLDEVDDKCFMYAIETINNKYQFDYCDDLDFFIEEYNKLPDEEKVLYEIFRENKPVKMFLDIDMPKTWGVSSDDVYRDIMLLINEFNNKFFKDSNNTNIAVLDSTQVSGKISLHILDFNNHFLNITDMKRYYVMFEDYAKKSRSKYYQYIDFHIATKNRMMRMIGSHKRKDPTRILVPALYNCNSSIYPVNSKMWYATHIGKKSIPFSFEIIKIKKQTKLKKTENVNISDKDIKLYIGVYKKETATNYKSWWEISSAIYSILGDSGKDLYLEFSKKAKDKYDEAGCEAYWDNRKFSDKFNNKILLKYFHKDKTIF